jgi:four helix bundle protein
MSVIQSYRDLRVWQLGMDLAAEAYRVTKGWPREELFGLTSQVRRSASSVPANVAEGFGREASGSFAQFLRNAQGSLKEFETHVLLAVRVGLLEAELADELLRQSDDLGRMLGALIRKVAADPSRRLKQAVKKSSRPTTDDRRPTLDEASSQ